MKRYIKSTTDVDNVQYINDLASKRDISSITTLLIKLPEGVTLRLAMEPEANHTTSFDKVNGKWVEFGTDKYSSHDIADEIVNGRYNYAIEIKDTPKLKPMHEVPDRYKPKMWR